MKKSSSLNLLLLAFLTVFFSSLFPISIAFDSETDNELAFTYNEGTGKGPKKWGLINKKWEACNNGKMQSPINILKDEVEVLPSLGKLKRDYKAAPATVQNRGHDITVRWKEDAGKIKINGTVFKLVQCHWHSPSEHIINGSRYEVELHMVHLSSEGGKAVVGILYKYGTPDSFLSKILHHIKSVGKEERDLGMVNPGEIKFGSRKYFRYIGSLTVPPCTEGVIWTIGKKVRTASREQVKALRDAVHDGFKANARPIQPLDGRSIYLYSHHKI
ncbi:alpha carbonic anhydrase 4 [Manihot esculenta]|uniref:Carbonic anhydrase n=1 Tax=Manihot esculenta TaxID=3983 RepID=A0A2C9V878_MANES|nr:alpha carbonic anhydrase 4 [Manihot esculenta]